MAVLLKKAYRELKNKLFVEGALSFANTTLLSGIFLVGFALMLGADNFQLGILLAIPLLANLIQLFSAFILEATGTKKWTTIVSLFFGRFMWLSAALMAFGLLKEKNSVFLFIIILLVSYPFISIGNLSLLSWIKDLVPLRRLARFFGKRNMYASIGGIVVYLAGSYVIDKFPGKQVYGYLFLAAFIIGLLGIMYLKDIPERRQKIKAINPKKFLKRLKLPLHDQNFKPLLYFGLLWAFSINLAAPFFLVFMLKDLSLSFFLVSVFLVIDTFARIYGLNLWRRIADKLGAKPILAITATITSFVPLAFVFISKSNYLLILPIFVIGAISYAGVDIAIAQVLFKSAPRRYDAYYLSVFSSLTGFTSAIGPILGGLISVLIKDNLHLKVIDTLPSLKYVFLLSFLLRISCVPLIAKIQEKKAKDVGDVIERIRTLRFASFFANIYSFAHYTSKVVLVPQKQLFILQRKTAEKMKKDISNGIVLLSRISITLKNLTVKNIQRYKEEIIGEEQMLEIQLENMEHVADEKVENILRKTLSKIKSLKPIFEKGRKKEIEQKAEEVKRVVEGYGENLDKTYKEEHKQEALNNRNESLIENAKKSK